MTRLSPSQAAGARIIRELHLRHPRPVPVGDLAVAGHCSVEDAQQFLAGALDSGEVKKANVVELLWHGVELGTEAYKLTGRPSLMLAHQVLAF